MSGVSRVPATTVFGWGPALVSFDSNVGYGENGNINISLKVMILEGTKGLVILSVRDLSTKPPGYRKLAIPLEKCFSIEPDHGLLFNDRDEPAAGVLSHYVETLGFELPEPHYTGPNSHMKRGKRVWYGHREKQYRYLDLRIMGIPEGLKWKGTPLEKMSHETQAIIADYEKHLDLDFLVLNEANSDMPRIDEFIRICERVQEESDRRVAIEAQGTKKTSISDQEDTQDQNGIRANEGEDDISAGEQGRERSGKFKKNLATMLVDMASMVKELLTSDILVTEEMSGASLKAVRALQELAGVTKEARGGS
ncbi:unnamed protein product [Cercospora beticola]|nr:unnamed protein product [Cercospora beticola]